jgi:hypothetical protein
VVELEVAGQKDTVESSTVRAGGATPKEVHLRVVKRIMRYLVYTPKFLGFGTPRDPLLT